MNWIRGKSTIAACAWIAAAGLSATVVEAQARDFTVASWGGASNQAIENIYLTPFAKEKGINALMGVYEGGWGQFRTMIESGERIWDLASVEPAEMQRGCEEGLFVKLDWSKIGPAENYLPGVVGECGMGELYTAQTIAYNNALIGEKKPSSIQDFFDIKTWPGKRGILDRPKPTLEWVLLADGVPEDQIFDVLSTPEGVDRAFAKLDTIKSELLFWTKGAQPPEWLNNGEVTMTQAFSGRIVTAQKESKPFMQVWDHAIIYLDRWVMIEGGEHQETAYEFLRFFSDPARQAEYAIKELPYGPISVGAAELIPAEVAAGVPAGDNVKNAYYTGSAKDISFWIDHNDELTERWNQWKSKP